MHYCYHTVDVFSTERFGGNPLAVVVNASGLSSAQMQQIAREFNYSETTFVLPSASPDNAFNVRIFTPAREIPFAGHPNVGTAHVLATSGALGAPIEGRIRARFEESAGIVDIDIDMRETTAPLCEIAAPQSLTERPGPDVAAVAMALGLSENDIVTQTHAPTIASVGLAFLLVELRDLTALARARPQLDAYFALMPEDGPVGVHAYTRNTDDSSFDIRARMFAPRDSVPEDPATGSANCALAGLLAQRHGAPAKSERCEVRYRIGQGFEMGRASDLQLRVELEAGVAQRILLAGRCADVMHGELRAD